MLTRRDFCRKSLAAGAYASLAAMIPRTLYADDDKRNVLFIAVDDLRPQLGCYGFPEIHSPNIDALAQTGTVFNRAYCQQAVCSPSRTSLLTGLRPDTTRVYNLQDHFRKFIPDAVTLPQHFKRHGYHTQGFSKIFHGGLDDPDSWSVPHWVPNRPMYLKPETLRDRARREQQLIEEANLSVQEAKEKDPATGVPVKVAEAIAKLRGPAWEDPDCSDSALSDGMTADEVIKALRECRDKPFFLGFGLLKPHLPFVAPKKYFDLYPAEKITLAPNPFPPEDAPDLAFTAWGELRSYSDIPKEGPLSDEKARELIRAYYASISYIDAQIGRVVSELERLGLRDKTIIVLWGDHGWQLGEHGMWSKHTNFEEATHAPLIFSAPGQRYAGAKTNALAEFVDIYPTLCELAGLPILQGLEGTSLVPVLDTPWRRWKDAAFSQYPRHRDIMGYSMRTDRYRYTEWARKVEEPVAVELYDYRTDPQGNVNIAGLAENEALISRLSKRLRAGWRGQPVLRR